MSSKSKRFSQKEVSTLAKSFAESWERDVKKTFDEYMTIPNVSPSFDENWKAHGHLDKAMSLYETWARAHAPADAEIFVQQIENKTPLLVIDIPARNYANNDCVLLYGHVDKQPPMTGWRDGIEPFAATYIDDRLYGRGGADDGYAMFSALLACKNIHDAQTSHARHVVIIEASEESGSPDLPAHLGLLDSTLTEPLGDVSLVVCLDSGALTYDHFWITRSLRGLVQLNVSVRVLDQGTHSGGAGGIVPSTFHIMRELLDRIAKPGSGEIIVPELIVDIRSDVASAAENVAEIIGDVSEHGLPFADGVEPIYENVAEQIIANTYKTQLEVIGLEGIPALEDAGNVLRPIETFALSFRIPPGVDPHIAAAALTEKFIENPPYNARVSVQVDSLASGWEAPVTQPWLHDSAQAASTQHFGNDVNFMGEGGTIPFMAMLGEKYPSAQFLVTGILGPENNAHGPNEFMHLPTLYRITACVHDVLVAHGSR